MARKKFNFLKSIKKIARKIPGYKAAAGIAVATGLTKARKKTTSPPPPAPSTNTQSICPAATVVGHTNDDVTAVANISQGAQLYVNLVEENNTLRNAIQSNKETSSMNFQKSAYTKNYIDTMKSVNQKLLLAFYFIAVIIGIQIFSFPGELVKNLSIYMKIAIMVAIVLFPYLMFIVMQLFMSLYNLLQYMLGFKTKDSIVQKLKYSAA